MLLFPGGSDQGVLYGDEQLVLCPMGLVRKLNTLENGSPV